MERKNKRAIGQLGGYSGLLYENCVCAAGCGHLGGALHGLYIYHLLCLELKAKVPK